MPKAMDKVNNVRAKVSPICTTILALIAMAVPISMVGMGAIYLNDCPAQNFIPIYLIVHGAFLCFWFLIRLMAVWRQDDDGTAPTTIRIISFLVIFFLLAWFITGSVWIYTLYDNYSTNQFDSNFCDDTFYQYAFWVTTVTYMLLGLIILLACCCCVCLTCFGGKATVSSHETVQKTVKKQRS